LTIKLTRHTAATQFFDPFSALSFRAEHDFSQSGKSYGVEEPAFLSIGKIQAEQTTTRRVILGPRLPLIARTRLRVTYTSGIEALIKFTYSLVDCPIYSVIKHRPREPSMVVGRWPLAKTSNLDDH
jgi:hypothetical protein